jgi:hypothetical protein
MEFEFIGLLLEYLTVIKEKLLAELASLLT